MVGHIDKQSNAGAKSSNRVDHQHLGWFLGCVAIIMALFSASALELISVLFFCFAAYVVCPPTNQRCVFLLDRPASVLDGLWLWLILCAAGLAFKL
ncbi:hypothetical protein [Pseudoalteromonas sp. S16_S37]|uniref:hypothetical protein n=1 Tax=Pseudoalteromonas sp. S16_S37 TaxID=2720228 RepID=UPI001680AA93|nr:hypothetical protein [Pseudoalteromonas sp. S16_S37]MBD1584297.1 hypothetical protein [Pseudoalteromonas sp. S16_S37]